MPDPLRSSRPPRALGAPAERLVAIVVFPGVTLLDVAAPLQVLGRLDRPYRTVLVAERRGPVATDSRVTLTPDTTFDAAPEPDALVVPGGGLGLVRALADTAVTGYVASAGAGARIVGAACTGSLLLAGAGLLAGRRATTHRGYAPLLERLGAHYTAERVVQDGSRVTAAGGAAVLAMSLLIAGGLAGESAVRRISSGLDLEPPVDDPATRAARPELLGHLPPAEAVARLASMRLVLAGRPDLLARLGL